jgi:hypothetical protein
MIGGNGGVLGGMADDLIADLRAMTDEELRRVVRAGRVTVAVASSPRFDALVLRIGAMAAAVLDERERLGRATTRAVLPPVEGSWAAEVSTGYDDDGEPDREVVGHWPDLDDRDDDGPPASTAAPGGG